MPSPVARLTVLMVSASPDTSVRLRVDREFRDVVERVRGARFRDRICFVQVQAARFDDLRTALMEHQPRVLHISAHGRPDGSLLFEGRSDGARRVPRENLLKLLTALHDDLQLVVINACDSGELAKVIPPVIDTVIGMSDEISDTAATEFAVAFYESLAFGRSIESAYNTAIAGIDTDEDHIPQLFPPVGQDPAAKRQVRLLAPDAVDAPEMALIGSAPDLVAAPRATGPEKPPPSSKRSFSRSTFMIGATLLSLAVAVVILVWQFPRALAPPADPGALAPATSADVRILHPNWKGPMNSCDFAGTWLMAPSVSGRRLEDVLEKGSFTSEDAVFIFDLEAEARVKIMGIEILASAQDAPRPDNCERMLPEEPAHLFGVVLEPSPAPRRFSAQLKRPSAPGSVWLDPDRAEEFYVILLSRVRAIYDIHAVIVTYSRDGRQTEVALRIDRRIAFL